MVASPNGIRIPGATTTIAPPPIIPSESTSTPPRLGAVIYPSKPTLPPHPRPAPSEVVVSNPFAEIGIDGVGPELWTDAYKHGWIPQKLKADLEKENFHPHAYRIGTLSFTKASTVGLATGHRAGIPERMVIDPATGKKIDDFERSLAENQAGRSVLTGKNGAIIGFPYGPGGKLSLCGKHLHGSLWQFNLRDFSMGLLRWGFIFMRPDALAASLISTAVISIAQMAREIRKGLHTWKDWKQAVKTSLEQGALGGIFQRLILRKTIFYVKLGIPIKQNFPYYDIAAHNNGKYSIAALRALRSVLKCVWKVKREVNKHPGTIFWIDSDHSHIDGESFSSRNDGQTFREYLTERFQVDSIQITAWGGHAHIYFDGTEDDRYGPRFKTAVKELYLYEGIGIVAEMKRSGAIRLHTKAGDLVVRNGKIVTEGREAGYLEPAWKFIEKFGDPDVLAYQIHEEFQEKNCGKLVVYADLDSDGRTTDFEDHCRYRSNHGSIGGQQDHGLMITRKRLNLNDDLSSKYTYYTLVEQVIQAPSVA